MSKYDYYIKQYEEAHLKPHMFPGISIRRYVDRIKNLIDLTETKTMLDYGCGKGLQYTDSKLMAKHGGFPQDKWGILPELYDPAVEKYNVLPEVVYDGVICTDVLEHVPEESTDFVIESALSKATKFAFFSIATYLGRDIKEILPNGEQPHITVKTPEWWTEKFKTILEGRDLKVGVAFVNLTNNVKNVTDWNNYEA